MRRSLDTFARPCKYGVLFTQTPKYSNSFAASVAAAASTSRLGLIGRVQGTGSCEAVCTPFARRYCAVNPPAEFVFGT
jgi:hypothetical protein